MIRRLTQLALLLLALDATLCLAQEPTESRWRLGAALGYGVRSNPLVQSDDIPIIVDVDIAWFGDRWFFDNGDLGLTMADNDAITASLIARVNSDRVFFGNTDTRFVAFDLAGAPLTSVLSLSRCIQHARRFRTLCRLQLRLARPAPVHRAVDWRELQER
jgi:hypothetical protein